MRKTLRSLWYILSLSFRADPWRTMAGIVTVAVAQASRSVGAFAISRIVGAVLAGDSDRATTWVVVLAAVGVGGLVAALVRLDLRFRLEETTTLLIDRELIAMTAGTPGLEQHERPEHLDRLELLRQQRATLGGSIGALVENVGSVTSVVSTTLLLATVDPRLLLLPLFGVPSVASSAWRRRINAKVEEGTAERVRTAKHLFQLATSGPPAKELRVFGLQDELRTRYIDVFDGVNDEFNRAAFRITAISIATWLLFALAYVGTMVFVVSEAVKGRASAADVVLVSALASQVNEQVSNVYWMLSWLLETLKTVGRFLTVKDDCAAAAPVIAAPSAAPSHLAHGVDLVDVGFRYPGTEADVLRGVSLHLPAGSTVAVVGDNGAGKSTLMKLLCGFYAPTSGAVLVDGVDLRTIPPAEWRTRMSAGFQDFARLELVARETVGVGELSLVEDVDAVAGALDRAAASDVVLNLADGLETQVGRMFEGGVELSGGQWQKLALGRAMMREQPLVLVLDEPTAALDADTEHALFERYAGAARTVAAETGGITVLVSHRFSTVRMADLIVVVSGGTVVEAGSHEELMAAAGTYAELFELQARAYR